tara:strand:+ start:2978 stop:3949 length:972 start_codon:yes stop_codon:yes gene_type:complete
MNILITGTAGFIGSALAKKLCENGLKVIGIDNHNDYYDTNLKLSRVKLLLSHNNYKHYECDIANKIEMSKIFLEEKPNIVFNLAAQAGVRYSIEYPQSYIDSNISGFQNILDLSKETKVSHVIYASSSSVYGLGNSLPYSVKDRVDRPVSIYAVSKKTNELMAHVYSHMYKLPTTGLRFFTVYGPWGRPDMAAWIFTKAIFSDEVFNVFNYGKHSRDFTYIDDIISGLVGVMNSVPVGDTPYKIYNIGNNKAELLTDFISYLEKYIGKKAKVSYLNMQPGDVKDTHADIDDIKKDIGFKPTTELKYGLKKFVNWYAKYHDINI